MTCLTDRSSPTILPPAALNPGLDHAIRDRAARLLAHLIWGLDEEGGLSRARTTQLVRELDLDEGSELASTLDDAAMRRVDRWARQLILEIFEGLHDAMDEHFLEPGQMRCRNALARQQHCSRREEGPFSVYEYPDVKSSGQDIHIWEYMLPDRSSLYFEVVLVQE